MTLKVTQVIRIAAIFDRSRVTSY